MTPDELLRMFYRAARVAEAELRRRDDCTVRTIYQRTLRLWE